MRVNNVPKVQPQNIGNDQRLLINQEPRNFVVTTASFGVLKGVLGYQSFKSLLDEQVRKLVAQGLKKDDTTIALAQQILLHGNFLKHNSELYLSLGSVEDIFASLIENKYKDGVTGLLSDGDHTFDDLYNHRCTLFLALMRVANEHGADYGIDDVWFSRTHDDGEVWENYLIVGMQTPYGICTYNVREDQFLELMLSHEMRIKELERAPAWDGHNSDDVLQRLSATFLGTYIK